jgi:two-component system, NarL family, nitrate/nitrite response regulator NarL
LDNVMDFLSSDTAELSTPFAVDHRDIETIRASIPAPGRSETHAAPEQLYSCLDGSSARCQAVLLSKRGLFLDGLRAILGRSRISVVGEGYSISGLLAAVQTQQIPDLVICHIAIDRDSEAALELIRRLRRHFPGAKLVVLADACTTSLLPGVVGANVNAILLTSISGEMLLHSLELVLSDHCLFAPEIMPLISRSLRAGPARDQAPATSPVTFTKAAIQARAQPIQEGPSGTPPLSDGLISERERAVMDCLVRGLSNKCIGRELNIVEATVKMYLKCLSRKLKVSNRTQLAIWALRQPRLFDADDPAGAVDQIQLQLAA